MRPRLLRALLATFVTGTLVAPAVSAGPAPLALEGTDLTRALAAAQETWGELPCDGEVALRWVPDDAHVNATSYWATAPGGFRDCSIAFNPRADWDAAKLCTVFTHEIGHLHGHDHVHDDGDVMSVYYRAPVAACRTPSAQ